MAKLKIALIFGQIPNFDTEAFKYFILSLNKIQASYEFFFPDLDTYIFPQTVVDFDKAKEMLNPTCS